MRWIRSTLVAAAVTMCHATQAQIIWHVDDDALAGGDGLSWATAFIDLQDALAAALVGDEVWVAEGVYKPDGGTGNRDLSFDLGPGIGLYGGFRGDEAARTERDWTLHATILTGDLNGDDETVGMDDNSRYVVRTSTASRASVLSGVIITAAFCTSSEWGSAIENHGGDPTITFCTMTGNLTRFGAGIDNRNAAEPLVLNCQFLGNSSHSLSAGAAYVVGGASPVFVNCLFSGNASAERGGGVFVEGATVTLVNCTLSLNHADSSGGGVYVSSNGSAVVNNCILWGNTDVTNQPERGQLFTSNSAPVSVTSSCVQGWSGAFGGIGNHGLDPRFVDADGADDVAGTLDDDLRLAGRSPCIDAATNSLLPADEADLDNDGDITEAIPFDLLGADRFRDDLGMFDSGAGSPPLADIGALERSEDSSLSGYYTGPPNGSWFDPANWFKGLIPDSQTDVVIQTEVRIDVLAAVARSVSITANGVLVLNDGGLTASSLVVLAGGGLSLTDPEAEANLGILDVRPGAVLTWASGTVSLSSGESFVSHPLEVGTSGAAGLLVSSTASVTAPSIRIRLEGSLGGAGLVTANVINEGVVSPGTSAGRLTIDGQFDQLATGVLLIEVGGYAAGVNFDALIVTREVSVAGSLVVIELAGFQPILGNSQEFVTTPRTIMGSFDSVTLPALTGDFALHFQQDLRRLALLTVRGSVGGVVYVDADAPNGGDGLSWATALNSLHAAWELIGQFSFAEIWVAEGTYYPSFQLSGGDPRSVTFFLANDIQILGGFSGVENERHERDWLSNVTILSGDVGVLGDPIDNAYRVVWASNNITETAVLDGFTIRDGHAGPNEDRGAGIKCFGEPVIRNCQITDNWAQFQGAGVYADGRMTFIDCSFRNNVTQTREGGAIYARDPVVCIGCLFDNNVSPLSGGAVWGRGEFYDCVFTNNTEHAIFASGRFVALNCLFEGNTALGRGGAIDANVISFTVAGCDFVNNSAGRDGGAIRIADLDEDGLIFDCVFLGNTSAEEGGGVWSPTGQMTVSGCLFSGNTAQSGAGAWLSGDAMSVTNTTFANNSATSEAGGLRIAVAQGTGSIANTVFWGNDVNGAIGEDEQLLWVSSNPVIDYCCVQGLSGALGGTGNIGADPNWVDPLGDDLVAGTVDDDLRLAAGSPCIDAADNMHLAMDIFDVDDDGDTTELTPFDLDGEPRRFDDPDTVDTGNGTAPLVDMGPYEGPDVGGSVEPGRYIGPSGGSWFDPSHWAGGQVPDGTTNVIIATTVAIDQMGATAALVLLEAGGNLIIEAGSLTCSVLTVSAGAILTLDDPTALLSIIDLTAFGGALVQWNSGTVRLDGGTWTNASTLQFGHVGVATLVVLNDGSIVAPEVLIGLAGLAQVQGSFVSNVTNSGVLEPGSSSGTTTIDGNLVQTTDGTLRVDLEGYFAGVSYDRLIVTQFGTLAGTLDTVLGAGFVPQVQGRMLVIESPNSLTGEFDTINLPSLPGDLVMLYEDLAPRQRSILTTLTGVTPRLYVNGQVPVGGNGQSWATALPSFQEALEVAAHFVDQVDEIWVAAGTYRPDQGTGDRLRTFLINEDWQLYGGFAGFESDPSKRDIVANPTVLSGDLAGDDGANFVNTAENSYRVLRVDASFAGTEFRLDGFTITGGNANSQDQTHRTGAGIGGGADGAVIVNCTLLRNQSSLDGSAAAIGGAMTVENCVFTENAAGDRGTLRLLGGIGLTIRNCTFTSNTASRGGAISARLGDHTIEDCQFIDNRAARGGSVVVEGHTTVSFTDCSFIGNTASQVGGAILLDRDNNPVSLTLLRCTVESNSAEAGGAIFSIGDLTVVNSSLAFNVATNEGGALSVVDSSSQATMIDCQIHDNMAGSDGGGISIGAGAVTLANTSVFDNQAGARGGGVYVQGSASLELDSSTISANAAAVGSGVYNAWIVSGAGSIGDEFQNLWRIQPGLVGQQPIGVLQLTGTLQHNVGGSQGQASAVIEMDIGGNTAGVEYDVLDASTGEVDLSGGALFANFIAGFEPNVGDGFDLIPTSVLNGEFHVVSVFGLPPDRFASLEYGASGVRLTIDEVAGSVGFASLLELGIAGAPADAVLIDVDQDGDQDIAMTIPTSSGGATNTVTILLNAGVDGTGQWLGFTGGVVVVEVGDGPNTLVTSNVNGDSFPDLLVANETEGSVGVLVNDGLGNGSFTVVATYPVGVAVSGVEARDLSGDLFDDFVAIDRDQEQAIFFVNDGLGGFNQAIVVPTEPSPVEVRLVDIDNDQAFDLVIASNGDAVNMIEPAISVRLSKGGFSFGSPSNTEIASQPADLKVVDLNADGFVDIVVASPEAGMTSIIVNDGGSLVSRVDVPVGDQPRSITSIDIELDGDIDLAVLVDNVDGDPVVRLVRSGFANSGQLVFGDLTDLVPTGIPLIMLAGDVDGDLLDDIVMASESLGDGLGATVGGFVNASTVFSGLLTDVTRTLGIHVSGGVAELRASDNEYYVLQSGPGFDPSEPHPARADFGFDTRGVGATTFDVSLEERANIGGPTSVVLLRNWTTGQWDEIARHNLSPVDQVLEMPGIPATDYINGSDRLEMRVRTFAVLILNPLIRGIFSHDFVGVEMHE